MTGLFIEDRPPYRSYRPSRLYCLGRFFVVNAMPIFLSVSSIVIAVLCLALLLWATGCTDSVRAWNERAAREEYAKDRAGCYETVGFWGESFRKCMKEKGWRE